MSTKIATLLVFIFLLSSIAQAQEARGSITGRVIDSQGAIVPGASVVVTNTGTSTITRTTTNETGYFEVMLLNPGQYSVAVEAPGFKRGLRGDLTLSVSQRLDLTIQLEVGAVTETVEVRATAPLLDTADASGGRVIDRRQMEQLPLGDMGPFALAALTPGMSPTGASAERRTFDKGGTSNFRAMGGVGRNEYTLDGASVTGTNQRVGFAPPPDVIDEFKIETMTFDAALGFSSGATINAVTKSGSNAFHGSLFENHRQQRWNATPHFVRLQYEDAVRRGVKSPDDPKQPAARRITSAPLWEVPSLLGPAVFLCLLLRLLREEARGHRCHHAHGAETCVAAGRLLRLAGRRSGALHDLRSAVGASGWQSRGA